MKAKFALLVLIFCLVLTGCKEQPTSTGAASEKSIQLHKSYNWSDTEKKYEKEAWALVTDSDDMKKIETALNRVIMPKKVPELADKESYSIAIVKDIGNGKWGKVSYSLDRMSENEYVVRTGFIDAEKEWWILDLDMELNGIFEKYLK